MIRVLLFLLFNNYFLVALAQSTTFERNSTKNITATYLEIKSYYEQLDRQYEQLKVFNYGITDIGKPLQLVVLSKSRIFDPVQIHKQNKRVILINNGLHPSEAEGVEASMMLSRDLIDKKMLSDSVVICIIPVYNIDGCLNRGTVRANQNGPETYGFMANYKNLDLNLDFIKTDSKNSYSFQEIFNLWQPDILIDNHNGNGDGADYQYSITLAETQRDKLNPLLAEFMIKKIEPELYSKMKQSGFEMAPLIKYDGISPDAGIKSFLETPRYSTGYAALHNTIGLVGEVHKLKPFHKRVYASYHFMKHLIEIVVKKAGVLAKIRSQANELTRNQAVFALNWELDKNNFETILYKGYEVKYKRSEVSGLNRLFYDRNSPLTKYINWYNSYCPTFFVKKPIAYVIPQAWYKVIDLLKLNQVQMSRLKEDQEIDLRMYYVVDYKTVKEPIGGHYLHNHVTIKLVNQKVKFYQGDYVVYVNQIKNRYIVETLEPQGVDSFFAWNFFDAILDRKEYFSPYLFEIDASKLLKENPLMRKQLNEEVRNNPNMAKSTLAQLDWVYKNSNYSEKTYLRYPVGRIETNTKLEFY